MDCTNMDCTAWIAANDAAIQAEWNGLPNGYLSRTNLCTWRKETCERGTGRSVLTPLQDIGEPFFGDASAERCGRVCGVWPSGGQPMRRRSFLTVFGGAAAARAQRHERMRRIGVLTGVAADDQEA